MCGRVSIAVNYDDMIQVLKDDYEIDNPDLDYHLPRYNVSPGQSLISVLSDGKKNRVGTLKWGLVPFWAKDEKIGYKMINAKAETLHQKPSFKHSFQKKRCIILIDGFYEWKKTKKEKRPMRFQVIDRNIFSLAGLWSTYTKKDGTKLYTCTIITTKPNSIMEPIHNRMPVILDKEKEKIWLNPKETNMKYLSSLLTPYNDQLMNYYEVSTLVNNPRNDRIECIEKIGRNKMSD